MDNQEFAQHTAEVAALRRRIAELEKREEERERAQQKLRETEASFRALVEQSCEHMFVLDIEGRYLISNNRVDQFGLEDSQQLVGHHLGEVYAPDVAGLYLQHLAQVVATGQSVRFEHPMPHPAGDRRHVDTLFPLHRGDAIWAVGGVCHDITQRSQMLESLRESEARFRAIFIGAPDAMFLADPESGQILDANPAASQLTLRPVDELVGLHRSELHPPHLQERTAQTFREQVQLNQQGQTPQPVDTFVLRADGRHVPVEIMTHIIPVEGRPVLLGTFRNVSERRETQRRLRQLSRAVEQSPGTVVITDTEGRIEYANPNFSQLTGYDASEVVGLNPRLLSSGKHAPEFYEQLWATIASGLDWRGEFVNRKKNGDLYWEMASISPVRNRQGTITHFVKVAADITEQKQAEEALRASEEKFRTLAEQSPNMIFINAKGKVAYANEKASQAMGYARQEFYAPDFDYLSLIAPQYRSLVETNFGRHARGEEVEPLDYVLVTKDGRPIEAILASRRIEYEGDWAILGTITDITNQKRVEEALRQSTVELQERNEDLDAFAHTVAHDLVNPASLLQGFADILVQDHADLPAAELERCLQTISTNARKMGNIVHELLLLASVRRSDVDLVPLNMGQIVARAQAQLKDMIDDYQAEIVSPNRWPQAVGHGPWVEQVWVNYLSNALKYGGQPPRIELGFEVGEDHGELRAGGTAPQMVRFWIRDNGPGLTQEEHARLYAPFTRLDQVHVRGYGMGLSIVRRIVEKLGGQVAVESDGVPGHGSTFGFTLPASTGSKPPAGSGY